ncbi:MAG: septal ring lytic transglycosylase RlpA family protein [Phyllobacterium sp.]
MSVGLAACASPKEKVASAQKPKSKEYFSESEYGVKASPRVRLSSHGVAPRGGGRDQVGKPYKVRGKWYYPKEEPGYSRKGKASWYGSAFHGRLTANGEVYDMHHLSAAHPTMPLPSYARVTNLSNGSSVIVRVNDRGPYSNGRVIDLSQKAAELLDYKHSGTANVQVDYVGRAPLEGRDDGFLMASFKGTGASDPIGQPASGVMIAMSGPTPTSSSPGALPGVAPEGIQVASLSSADAVNAMAAPALADSGGFDIVLPTVGPVLTEKPGGAILGIVQASHDVAYLSSYASRRIAEANSSVAAMSSVLSSGDFSTDWKYNALASRARSTGEYVDVGYFTSKVDADKLAAVLAKYGTVERSMTPQSGSELYGLIVTATDAQNTDKLLQAAWSAGAMDAFVVRQN